jgi:hypothetical protein
VNDFRPISLINSIFKIITKLLGDRLQSIIIPLVHKNQYGFIKTRTIQDYLGWAFEYIHQCQQSKKEIVIIKLDFIKAFDMIEHSAIIQMMHQLGFNEKWISWATSILSSTSTLVLLNGVPGKNLTYKRGVRHMDPLSPLLFVLATDLQCIINKAHDQGLLQLSIPSNDRVGFPIIQYANDTIILLQASQRKLLCLKALLEISALSTGLRVNYAKSGMVPLNMTKEKTELMTGVFECRLQKMPFTYLGLPMGTTRPRVEHYAPLKNRMERQLTSISSMLNHDGRLQLVNTILSASPTYTMCSLAVPVIVHEYFDRARRHCMWRNSYSNGKSKPLVAWKKCTKPKRKGGLGVINLKAQNKALLIKHLDKFYDKAGIPWVNLICNTYYSTSEVPHATKDKGSF